MAVTLKLYKLGKKGKPAYRIVAVEKRSKRNGRYIEAIGFYNPLTDPFTLNLDKERFDHWLEKGALISEGLRKLLKNRHFKMD